MSEKLVSGKVVLVTGGASGIGEATARLFSEQGATVVITDIQAERGKAVASSLPSALFLTTDVRDEQQVEAAVMTCVDRFGQLDCMINNAGAVGAVGSITQTSYEKWSAALSLLLDSVFFGMKHAAKVMIPRQTGCILSIASTAGAFGGLGPHAYTTAKHGVIGLTKSVASELGAHGIRVNAVAPGHTVTPLVVAARGDLDAALARSAETSHLNMAIMPGDIAASLLFLASDLGRQITAQTIFVDGGVSSIFPKLPGAFEFHAMQPDR